MVGLAGAWVLESHEVKHQPGSHWGYTLSSYDTNLALVHCYRKDLREWDAGLVATASTPWARRNSLYSPRSLSAPCWKQKGRTGERTAVVMRKRSRNGAICRRGGRASR